MYYFNVSNFFNYSVKYFFQNEKIGIDTILKKNKLLKRGKYINKQKLKKLMRKTCTFKDIINQ